MGKNNFAFVTKEFPNAVDEEFTQKSLTDIFLDASKKRIPIKFEGAKRVGILNVKSTGLTDYERGGHGKANERGSAESKWEYFTLGQERYSEIPVDGLDAEDDAEGVVGYLAGYFVKRHVIQEFDAFRFSKLTDYTSTFIGNRKVGEIADDKILTEFNDMQQWFANNKVPMEDRLIYVSTTTMKKIRNTKELVHYLTQKEYKEKVDFKLYDYEGATIIEVPEDEFYTNIVTDKLGYHPSADSKVINFLGLDVTVANAIKKVAEAHVYDSTGPDGTYLGFYGYLFTNLYYHDIFVSENGRVGIYAHVSNVNAIDVTNKAICDFKAGSVGNTILTYANTMPQGIKYDKIQLLKSASKPKVGSVLGGATEIFIDKEFTPDATNNIIVLTDANNVVLAVSDNYLKTLPKGA